MNPWSRETLTDEQVKFSTHKGSDIESKWLLLFFFFFRLEKASGQHCTVYAVEGQE